MTVGAPLGDRLGQVLDRALHACQFGPRRDGRVRHQSGLVHRRRDRFPLIEHKPNRPGLVVLGEAPPCPSALVLRPPKRIKRSGEAKAPGEWTVVWLAVNLKRFHRLTMV